MGSRWDSAVSSEAWERLVSVFRALERDGAGDFELADATRQIIGEVEGWDD